MKEDAELYQHTYSKIYNTENLHRSEDGNSLIDKLQTKVFNNGQNKNIEFRNANLRSYYSEWLLQETRREM